MEKFEPLSFCIEITAEGYRDFKYFFKQIFIIISGINLNKQLFIGVFSNRID